MVCWLSFIVLLLVLLIEGFGVWEYVVIIEINVIIIEINLMLVICFFIINFLL